MNDKTLTACAAADKAVAGLTMKIEAVLAGNPHGAERHARGAYHWPALDALCARRRLEWARIAIEHGADPERLGTPL